VLSAGDADFLGCAAAAQGLRTAPQAACAKETDKNPAIKRDPRMVLLPPPQYRAADLANLSFGAESGKSKTSRLVSADQLSS
jgi:hypothetical protein